MRSGLPDECQEGRAGDYLRPDTGAVIIVVCVLAIDVIPVPHASHQPLHGVALKRLHPRRTKRIPSW
jgi:hypothetical protein